MKYFNTLLLFFFAMLSSCEIDIHAYNYTIINKTGSDLRVQLYWRFGLPIKLTEKPKLIKNGKKHTFFFPVGEAKGKAGLCLGSIEVSKKRHGGWEWVNVFLRDKLRGSDIGNYRGSCKNQTYTLRTLADVSRGNYYDLSKEERRWAIKKPGGGYYILFKKKRLLKPGQKEIIYVDPYDKYLH